MIRGAVIPKHEHEKFLALSNPSDILDLSRTHPVFWGLAAKTRLITHSNAPVMAAVTFRCSARIGTLSSLPEPPDRFPRGGKLFRLVSSTFFLSPQISRFRHSFCVMRAGASKVR